MADVAEYGRRPLPILNNQNGRGREADLLGVCPGAGLTHTFNRSDSDLDQTLMRDWGPVYEVWEGYAADDDIRLAGSSGGAATALSLYGIEQGGMKGVLHAGARKDAPHLNETVYSTTRAELLANTGSRYAPASPCDSLHLIEERGASVFIGKPCDAAAIQKARHLRPKLDENLGLVIAFFCAGTPSTRGTLDLLKKAGVEDPGAIRGLRYRGNGWPGMWRVEWTDAAGVDRSAEMTYEESWGFLQKYRQWRCYICPDHTGEFADVAVGDPWYRPIEPGEPGKSLIIARTQRGREVIHAAAEAGYIVLETKDSKLLPRSQPNLLKTRGRLWGQLRALSVTSAAAPKYKRLPTFRAWSQLSVGEKTRSVLSTLKRVRTKRLSSRCSLGEVK